ncbi:MAG: hypothetical protein QXI16_03755, partial [Sulfolobaceae archaeon]
SKKKGNFSMIIETKGLFLGGKNFKSQEGKQYHTVKFYMIELQGITEFWVNEAIYRRYERAEINKELSLKVKLTISQEGHFRAYIQ